MTILRSASAGTNERGDILINISPCESGLRLNLTSPVMKLYGDDIRNTIINSLRESGAESANVYAEDKGAVNFVIKARVQTALMRSCREENKA